MEFGFYQLALLFGVVFLLAIAPIVIIAFIVYLVSKRAQRSDSPKGM